MLLKRDKDTKKVSKQEINNIIFINMGLKSGKNRGLASSICKYPDRYGSYHLFIHRESVFQINTVI